MSLDGGPAAGAFVAGSTAKIALTFSSSSPSFPPESRSWCASRASASSPSTSIFIPARSGRGSPSSPISGSLARAEMSVSRVSRYSMLSSPSVAVSAAVSMVVSTSVSAFRPPVVAVPSSLRAS